MAAMENAFCSYLLTKTAITNLIGTGNAARLWPLELPEGYSVTEGAAATYELISGDDFHTLSDRSGSVETRVQIAAYAETPDAAMALARAIKNCGITGLKGVSGGVDFRSVRIETGIQCNPEKPTDGSDSSRFVAEFDFKVSYLEE